MTAVGAQFEQLPLYMTAREIQAKYRPHEPDRNFVYEDGSPRDLHKSMVARQAGNPLPERKETDDEFWNRKYKESSSGPGEGDDIQSGPLSDRIIKEGVQFPISVSEPNAPHQGIKGGHHRLAVMLQHRPDDLVPVAHVSSPVEAWDVEGQSKRNLFQYKAKKAGIEL